MQVGVFASVCPRPTVEEVFAAVQAHGLRQVEFSMSCAGLPTLPVSVDDALLSRIRAAADRSGVELVSLSGQFNMIHPQVEARRSGVARLGVLLAAARKLGIGIVSLCTGTRDPQNMWRRHPANDHAAAFHDLLETTAHCVRLAARHDVVLAFEPEVSNVIDSAQKARRYLDTVQSRHLKVLFDGANIFHHGELPQMRTILSEAIHRLGPDIVLAHAKDLDHDGDAGGLPAGHGLLDYAHYCDLLRQIGFDGTILLHGLSEDQLQDCAAFVRSHAGNHL